MNFNEKLNEYINILGCSSKELANASKLSPAVISRYRNDERTPSIRSEQLDKLCNGLFNISKDIKMDITYDKIYKDFSYALNDIHIDLNQLVNNFNTLVSTLNINIAELSRKTGYDSSYLSKIKTGSTYPSKPQIFINEICKFVSNKYTSDADKTIICTLIDCKLDELSSKESFFNKIKNWLSTNELEEKNPIDDFLKNLDEFDLNEYIKVIHFDSLKVPNVPFYKARSKNYYGIEEMKKGELDFFKATVLSKTNNEIYMCSDMPMEDMAKDIDFGKKWMFAIAMTIKKGLHINIIHNIDRPFNEMMLGLESWIPIYMTGQVSPFYLKSSPNNVYCHLNYVSSSAALTGECIKDFHLDGKYYLTSNKDEIKYYEKKVHNLFSKATPLMKIYNELSKNVFDAFLLNEYLNVKKHRRILTLLPIHTMSNKLLEKMLNKNNISQDDKKNFIQNVNKQKKMIHKLLKENKLEDDIVELTKDEFEKLKPKLNIPELFSNLSINYTYEDYLKHLKETYEFAKQNKNYTIVKNNKRTFKNIQIHIQDNCIIISKNSSPNIHFVIHHPKLRKAIESFIPPITE